MPRKSSYNREKESGEIENHTNVLPGNGFSHRYFLDPATGVFKMRVQQASMPLLPVLRAVGITDKELHAAWGPDLLAANIAKDDPKVIDKLYEKFVSKKNQTKLAAMRKKRQAVANAITSMGLDPEVTKQTLGHPHDKLSKEALLATTKKLLAILARQRQARTRSRPFSVSVGDGARRPSCRTGWQGQGSASPAALEGNEQEESGGCRTWCFN